MALTISTIRAYSSRTLRSPVIYIILCLPSSNEIKFSFQPNESAFDEKMLSSGICLEFCRYVSLPWTHFYFENLRQNFAIDDSFLVICTFFIVTDYKHEKRKIAVMFQPRAHAKFTYAFCATLMLYTGMSVCQMIHQRKYTVVAESEISNWQSSHFYSSRKWDNM
jgi:hypothetical protein